jgi:hypothetical protein
MVDLASEGNGNVLLATLDQLRNHAVEFQENAQRLYELYQNGDVPLHLIAAPLNQTLAHFFHEYRNEAAASPYGWPIPPLLARHGRKGVPDVHSAAAEPWTLKSDSSALLLAYHYGFLEHVEQSFGPLWIPPQLIPSLVLTQQRLTTAQLSRIAAYREVLSCVADGRISSYEPAQPARRDSVPAPLQPRWLGAAEHAISHDGYLVDFLPIPAEPSPIEADSLPEDIQRHLVGPGAVLRTLYDYGPLTKQEYQAILDERLPSIRGESLTIVPAPGSALFFRGTAIEVLASIQALPHLVLKFRVFVEAEEVDRLKAELAAYDRHAESARWVKSLITHVSDGIQSGSYQVLSERGGREDDTGEDGDGLDAKSLKRLLRPEGFLNERVWIDDRCINGYERAETVEIVDSIDVMRHLVAAGGLSWADYFALVGRMRADGVCFVPLSEQEVLSAVEASRISPDGLVETTALCNLRRGVAVSLLQSSLLKHDPAFAPQPSRPSELGILLQTMRAVEDALVALHSVPADDDAVELRARRAWIVDSLYASPAAVRRLAQLPGSHVNGEYLEAIGHAGLLMRAVAMQASDAGRKAATKYMAWLFRRLIQPRIQQRPEFLSRITLAFSQLLESVVPDRLDDLPSHAAAIVLQRLFEDLPKDIRSGLLNNTDLLARIGIAPVSVVELAGMRLKSRDFFAAAAEVVNGRRGIAHEVDGDEEVIFTPAAPSHEGFRFEKATSGSVGTVNDPILDLLIESVEGRERVATNLFKDYDVPAAERPAAVAAVIVTDDVASRIAAAESQRDQDLKRFAAGLATHVQRGQPLHESDCWPERPDLICRFLRVNPQEEFNSKAIEHAYVTLLADHSPEEALARIMSVPCELPDAIEKQFVALPAARRRNLVKHVLRRPATPLLIVQLARVLVRCFGDEPGFPRRANARLRRLLRNETAQIKAYITLARWVAGRLRFWPDTKIWSEGFRLAAPWLLADFLLGTFMRAGIAPQWVIDRFTVTSVRAEHIFENEPEWQHDVAHPNNVEPEVFALCGLAYAFESRPGTLGGPLRRQVAATMLLRSEDHFFPVLPLLKQPGPASNRIDSFLGRDRIAALYASVEPEPEAELRTALAHSPLEQARAALQTLGARGWLVLTIVLGGFRPPDEFLPLIADAIKTTDFAAGVDGDLSLAAWALSVAASHLPTVGTAEDLRDRLKDQLVLLVRTANDRPSKVTDQFGAMVLEGALHLARTKPTVSERVLDFSTFVARLVLECPRLGRVVRATIQRVCEGLPIELATEIWRLNLRLRTANIL